MWDVRALRAIKLADSIPEVKRKQLLKVAMDNNAQIIYKNLQRTTNQIDDLDDIITAAKFDESTAFPVKSVDTGATQIARVGADGDTLETLSDQIDDTALVLNKKSSLLNSVLNGICNEPSINPILLFI